MKYYNIYHNMYKYVLESQVFILMILKLFIHSIWLNRMFFKNTKLIVLVMFVTFEMRYDKVIFFIFIKIIWET